MIRPVDHHGFPCPDRFWPLEDIDVVLALTDEDIVRRRKARGDYVAGRARTNFLSEVMRGYQWRPPEERARIDAVVRQSDEVEALKAENARLRQENRELKASLQIA